MAGRRSPFAGDAAFDPGTLQIMTSAFDDAWQSLQTSGIKFESGQADTAREMLAKCIVEMAKLGERDHGRLRDSALADVAKKLGTQDRASD